MNRRGFLRSTASIAGGLLTGAGGSVSKAVASVPSEAGSNVIPWHGPALSAADLDAYTERLRVASARIAEYFEGRFIPTALETTESIRSLFGMLTTCRDWMDENMGSFSEDEGDWYDDWESDE